MRAGVDQDGPDQLQSPFGLASDPGRGISLLRGQSLRRPVIPGYRPPNHKEGAKDDQARQRHRERIAEAAGRRRFGGNPPQGRVDDPARARLFSQLAR